MAILTAISNKTQSAVAMKRVLGYVMQDYKTMFYDELTNQSYKLVSGQNCVPESAYSEFMATKRRYNKAKGVFFKQYVQSFKPDCGATPQQIHQIGIETAKAFDGFEVVVATHIDRDHWHNHIVVNSVNSETGLKIQINEKDLEQLRKRSDEICQQFGLEVLKPYKKPKQRAINQREYRTALRGNSKKLQLMNAIDYAVINSRSKEKFIENMKRLGYGVKWIDNYKYITYTTSDGQRFRDNRLFGEKYSKENMENLYGLRQTKTTESITTNKRTNKSGSDRTVQATSDSASGGAVQRFGESCYDDWRRNCEKYGFSFGTAQSANRGMDNSGRSEIEISELGERDFEYELYAGPDYQTGNQESNGYSEGLCNDQAGMFETECSGDDEDYNLDEAEMDASWGDVAGSVLNLAADVQMIFQDNQPKIKKRYINERRNRRKDEPDENQSGGFEMSM